MSSQYENLPKPDDYAAFFKVSPAEAPTERLVRANRISGMVRAVAQPAPPVAEVQADVAAAADAAAIAVTAQAADAVPPADPAAAPEAAPAAKPKAPPVQREWVPAQFGFVASWVKSASDAKLRAPKQVVARNETVSTVQAYRDAWLAGQRCIIPMQAFFEDDLRSGKPVPTRISRVDGEPMGVAGVWSSWIDPVSGQELISYAILTVNANSHALMHRYQHQGSEKRMPAILNEGSYDAWLTARQEKAREFLRAYPANWLTANPVERKQDKKPKGWLG